MALFFKVLRSRFFLVVQKNATPDDSQWDSLIGTFKAALDQQLNPKGLTFTEGGAPNGKQRERLRLALNGRSVSIAVVSESILPRMAAHALSVFNQDIKAFRLSALAQALDHLQVDEADRAEVIQTLKEMLRAADMERYLKCID